MAHFLWNFWEVKHSFKINRKTRIGVISENLGKLLSEQVQKELARNSLQTAFD